MKRRTRNLNSEPGANTTAARGNAVREELYATADPVFERLARQGIVQTVFADAGLQVGFVNLPDLREITLQRLICCSRSLVTRSLKPLPSRTVICRFLKSTSLTRKRRHSMRRRPKP